MGAWAGPREILDIGANNPLKWWSRHDVLVVRWEGGGREFCPQQQRTVAGSAGSALSACTWLTSISTWTAHREHGMNEAELQ